MSKINANLPLDKAELIGFFLECVLYGVSVLLFAGTIWVLIFRRKSESVNIRLVIVSCVMMLFNTLHLSVDLIRIFEGLIVRRYFPGGSIAYYGRLFEWSFVFKTCIFVLQTVFADSFATYRCYAVWHNWWATIAPVISVLITLVTGLGVVYNCAILHEGEDIFSSALMGWITTFFSLTLVTNLLCTSLIASRIWFITSKIARFSKQHTLLPVVVVVVESGAIYSIGCIIILVVYLLGSNVQYPAIDAVSPLISIVFNLITVRIALGVSHGGTTMKPNTSHQTAVCITDSTRSQTSIRNGYSMKPIAVTVTQLVREDSDGDGDATRSHVGQATDCGQIITQVREKEHGSWSDV